jgi:hypothetical protein
MAQLQVQLEIDTGAGGTALAGKVGMTQDAFIPVWDIAFGGTGIGEFHGMTASDVIPKLDAAIDSLQWSRKSYTDLTPVQQAMRPQAEAYLILWRDLCRKHPACRVTILP